MGVYDDEDLAAGYLIYLPRRHHCPSPMPLILLLTAILSALLVNLIRQRLRAKLLDIPNHRSSHTIPTPRGGGLGMLLAFVVALPCLLWLEPSTDPLFVAQVVSVLFPLALIGYLDDLKSLPTLTRYGIQLLSAGLAVLWFGPFPQPWLMNFGALGVGMSIVLTLIGFTTLVNLTNFMDGLDGLVGGISFIQFCFLAWYLSQPIWFVLALGGAMTLALLSGSQQMATPSQSWALLALTLPITGDAIYTLFRRFMRHENLFQAHRSHIYQRLHQQGIAPATLSLTYMGITVLTALALTRLGSWGALFSLALTVVLGSLAEIYLHRHKKKPDVEPWDENAGALEVIHSKHLDP
jgi:UDP-N-acetylmuramyl pentapeptide phosphotransferase/UDP-N-acetylglucosamine-1-phosphate transferase